MKRFLPIALLSVLSIGCNKEESGPPPNGYSASCPKRLYFEGKVVDSLTGQVLEGAMVFDGDISLLEPDTTDADGNFLVFQRYNPCGKIFGTGSIRPDSVLVYLSGYSNYHGKTIYSAIGVADNDTVKNCVIEATPYSWVNVHVIGTTAGEPFWLYGMPVTTSNCRTLGSGPNIDTILLCKVYSNWATELQLQRGGTHTYYSSTYYYAGHGVSGDTIEIHYP